jgi:hypothetical protein
MHDVYCEICEKLSLVDLLKCSILNKDFNKIAWDILKIKIRAYGFINYLKSTTIFPVIKGNRVINVFTKKYRNRENEIIMLFK